MLLVHQVYVAHGDKSQHFTVALCELQLLSEKYNQSRTLLTGQLVPEVSQLFSQIANTVQFCSMYELLEIFANF